VGDSQSRRQWERSGITQWDFDDLPDVIETRAKGLPSRAYPALQLTPQGLALKLLARQADAETAHREGVAELIRQHCSSEMKTLKKALADQPGLILQSAHWLKRDMLEADFGRAVVATILEASPSLVYTRLQFDAALLQVRPRLVPDGLRLSVIVGQIFSLAQQIRVRLNELKQPVHALARQDMQAQLDGLDLGQCWRRFPAERWQQYPRYLKGMLLRLEKLSNNLLRDDKGSAELQQHELKLRQAYEDRVRRGLDVAPLAMYRWLLEEYRISMFSQPLKTAVPVSAERLDRLWSELKV